MMAISGNGEERLVAGDVLEADDASARLEVRTLSTKMKGSSEEANLHLEIEHHSAGLRRRTIRLTSHRSMVDWSDVRSRIFSSGIVIFLSRNEHFEREHQVDVELIHEMASAVSQPVLFHFDDLGDDGGDLSQSVFHVLCSPDHDSLRKSRG
jgi:hypothetical protein